MLGCPKTCPIRDNQFHFSSEFRSIEKIEWASGNQGKLWDYNLNYFDCLTATCDECDQVSNVQLLRKWVKDNSPGGKVTWDPYPTSVRIINYIKFSLISSHELKDLDRNFYKQAKYLRSRIEWHLRGNHLSTNAKALLFAGYFFGSTESDCWKKFAERLFLEQIDEQVLCDGGHFELSPMYHSLFVEDCLDLINLLNTFDAKDTVLYRKLTSIVPLMIDWLRVMTHPCGELSFFNDSTLGIAPTLASLEDYARRLKLDITPQKFQSFRLLEQSGYFSAISKDAKLIGDVGEIGASYQPGHGHADILAFEFSLGETRVVVNGGISTYEPGSLRSAERSTKNHSTLHLNDQNSSEVWSSFRVGRRAVPIGLEIVETDTQVIIQCSHAGFRLRKNSVEHMRTWILSDRSLVVKDSLSVDKVTGMVVFKFHPNCHIESRNLDSYQIRSDHGDELVLTIAMGYSFLRESWYSPGFGQRIPTTDLWIETRTSMSEVKFEW